MNAMTSRQLLDFIEAKLAANNVGKVIPADAVLEQHARHLIEQRLAQKAFEELQAEFTKQAQKAALPRNLRERLNTKLTQSPELSWDAALAAIVAQRRQ
jgi:hypothetical protein